MAYDVASSIHELLFEHETVIIPGFGGFVLNNQSANIDYIKSNITPPAKVPAFNQNLTINDGILIAHLKDQNKCTLDQAQQIVKDFVEEMNRKIEKKEIIEFPKVGRLYQDYNKVLQFLPYDTNFNKDAFGLPSFEVHPFGRTESSTATPAAADFKHAAATIATGTPVVKEVLDKPKLTETTTAASAAQNKGSNELSKDGEEKKSSGLFKWTQMMMPLLVLATLTVVGLSYYLLSGGNSDGQDGSDSTSSLAVNDTKKINTSPSIEEAEIITLPEDDATNTDDDTTSEYEEEDMTTEEDIVTSTEEGGSDYSDADTDFSVESKEAVVIVGQFSNKTNADKYAAKVESDGYESFTGWNEAKEWHMVGVKFTYEKNKDKIRMVKRMKDQYDESAWLLEK